MKGKHDPHSESKVYCRNYVSKTNFRFSDSNMLTKYLLILLFLILSSKHSAAQKLPNNNYIVYGVYCGECVKHCAIMYKLDNNNLFIDSTDSFLHTRFEGVKYKFNGVVLNKRYFTEAKNLQSQIPSLLLGTKDTIFGKPDNHDQCGIYVQIKVGKKLKFFEIDTDLNKIPPELHHFAKRIIELL